MEIFKKKWKKWLPAVIIIIAFTSLSIFLISCDKKIDISVGGENMSMKAAKLSITQEDLIYFVFTDRFCNGDKSNDIEIDSDNPYGYHGGDIRGIINQLDYIKELGFTAIWISPVVKNDPGSYHGYLGIDFYKMNPNFGTMDEMKALVSSAHSKGIKVILDFVVNHTGRTHPWASDPKYYDWFHHRGTIVNWDDQTEVEEGDQDGLPDFNQDNPETKKYLLEMTKWWIEQTGVDGFRLDTFRHVPVSFWKEFVAVTRSINPSFYIVGEVFDGPIFQLADYQTGTGVDGMLDYPIYNAVKEVFGASEGSANSLAGVMTNSIETYQNPYLMGTFIDNHDVPRFIYPLQVLSANDKIAKLKQALTFMMTYTGIPIMYYGTEIAMEGGPDPDNRRDMDWNARSPVTDYVKQLTNIRKGNAVFTHGNLKVLRSESDFICYNRTYENRQAIVAFNTSKNKISYEVQLDEGTAISGSVCQDLLNGSKAEIKDGKVVLNLEPYQSAIFVTDFEGDNHEKIH